MTNPCILAGNKAIVQPAFGGIPLHLRIVQKRGGCDGRMRDMAQFNTILDLAHSEKGLVAVGAGSPPRRVTGWHLCRSYRAAHQRPCRDERQSLNPQKGLGCEALPRTHNKALRAADPTLTIPREKEATAQKFMWPMESNVRSLQSASFWAADLHRRACEWEFLWT